ncbi:MFS transporter [uncultured Jatrophihabitans sp.]|uniref:MFS transporter n=1 Tax=uncultured Jatrophihabitans sp. TaxID=1610747 RepID=UPI0035CBB8A6
MTTTLSKSAGADAAAEQHAKRWWILAMLGVAQLMVVLDSTIVNIALPTVQTDLRFSNDARQWIVTAYALAFGSLLLIGGRIADIIGRKRVLLIGLVGFAVASAVGGASVDVGMLIAARAVQGLFGALLAPAILSLLTTTFTEPGERAKAFGVFGAIAGAGASIGLLLGGILTEYATWRWTLFVNLIFAAITFIGASILLKDRPAGGERPGLDLPGTIVGSAGLFALVYGFSNAETHGWANSLTIGFLVASGVLLIAFVVIEQRIHHPLLPMRIVTDRNRGGAYVSMFIASVGIFAVFLFLTYYLQRSQGFSAIMTGVAFLPLTGTLIVVASIGSTLLVTRVSPRLLIPSGMVISAAAMWLLTRIGLDTTYASAVLPATLLLGVGLGLVFSPAFSLATLGVDENDAGVASAVVNTAQQVGGSVGTALLNTIAASAGAAYVTAHLAPLGASPSKTALAALQEHAAIHSYTVPFWWAAGVFLVGAVLSASILRSGIPQVDPNTAGVAV